MAMTDLRRFVRRLLGRDPQPTPPPIPSLSPVNNSPSLAAAAAPPETQQALSSGDADRRSSHISVASTTSVNPVIIEAHRPFATPSIQHGPATTTSPGAVPTQHRRVELRTPTNSTVASRFSFRPKGRSDTNGTRRFTIGSLASQDLQRNAKKKSGRIATHPESYPTYNLEWKDLREWLNNSFPECHFAEDAVGSPTHLVFLFIAPGSEGASTNLGSQNTYNDSYVFNIPRPLTPEEKEDIYKLRSDYHPDRE